MSKYLPFEEARRFARQLHFWHHSQWHIYVNSGKKPPYIPDKPAEVYKYQGFLSYGDWLGYQKLVKYKTAKLFVRRLNFKTIDEWNEYCRHSKKPNNIPNNPQRAYKYKGWISWAHWFGEEITFAKLKSIIRNNSIKTKEDYYKFVDNLK